jgi:hypothetical protein
MGDNDFDYDEIQAKLNPPPVEGEDAAEKEAEDDQWTVIDPIGDEPELTEEDDKGEAVEEDKPVAPTPAPGAPKPAATPPAEADAQELKDALIAQNGADFVLKVKGIERKLKDIPSAEIKAGLQKAFRSDQIFNELSSERKSFDEEKRRFEEQRTRQEEEFQALRDHVERLRAGGPRQDPRNQYGQPADDDSAFSPTDTPEVRQYKAELKETQEKINRLEEGMHKSSQIAFVTGVESEIKALSKDYPMAPLDEVIAVKLARPSVKTEDLMKAAHDYYRGDQHIELALANNPEYMTKLAEKAVKDFIAKRQSAKKIVGVSKSSSGSDKVVSEGKKQAPIRDFKSAEIAARAYMKEMQRKGND